jgi:hypothetical protein
VMVPELMSWGVLAIGSKNERASHANSGNDEDNVFEVDATSKATDGYTQVIYSTMSPLRIVSASAATDSVVLYPQLDAVIHATEVESAGDIRLPGKSVKIVARRITTVVDGASIDVGHPDRPQTVRKNKKRVAAKPAFATDIENMAIAAIEHMTEVINTRPPEEWRPTKNPFKDLAWTIAPWGECGSDGDQPTEGDHGLKAGSIELIADQIPSKGPSKLMAKGAKGGAGMDGADGLVGGDGQERVAFRRQSFDQRRPGGWRPWWVRRQCQCRRQWRGWWKAGGDVGFPEIGHQRNPCDGGRAGSLRRGWSWRS